MVVDFHIHFVDMAWFQIDHLHVGSVMRCYAFIIFHPDLIWLPCWFKRLDHMEPDRRRKCLTTYYCLFGAAYWCLAWKNNKLKMFNYRVGCWGNSLKSWRGCMYFECCVLRAWPILSPHFGHWVEAPHQNCQSCVKAFRSHINWACVHLCVRRKGTLTSCRYCTQIRDTFFPHSASLYQEFHWKSNSNKVTQTCKVKPQNVQI